jgi:hypothetical protein
MQPANEDPYSIEISAHFAERDAHPPTRYRLPDSGSARGGGNENSNCRSRGGKIALNCRWTRFFKVVSRSSRAMRFLGRKTVMSRTMARWRGGAQRSRDRFIYIHGTKHEDKIGIPDSHGCVRMRNADVAELFTLVNEGTHVLIEE